MEGSHTVICCVFRYHGYVVGFTLITLWCGYCCVERFRIHYLICVLFFFFGLEWVGGERGVELK
jgi:hypothetical protein